MAQNPGPPLKTTQLVASTCLCSQVQRASRAIGRHFDAAFRPIGLNNWQFSLLMTLDRSTPLTVSELAKALAMDRTTTTKNLRLLEGRKLVQVQRDDQDARVKRIILTASGRELLKEAVTFWKSANKAVVASLKNHDLKELQSALETIAAH